MSVAFADRAGAVTVLADSVDVALRPSRLHCVTGLGGSGKTSVLSVAAGLLQPTSGTVAWNGEELDGLSQDAVATRRSAHLGYVDQESTLLGHLSVVENVLLPAVPRRRAGELAGRAAALLAEYGVGELADARPAELTIGERRRVALARALLLEPPLLILDEPTAGLDRPAAARMIAALEALREAGSALFVASSDQALIDAADVRTTLGTPPGATLETTQATIRRSGIR
ncbi:hypothetical protein AWU67_03335 [Microterricola viridarii]|uniref:ABC transporter domain-containing protein n=1 Tax=Microterricola viridarii TaxID=412690 RepID=A0A109QWI2_9MICO|nr:hypothetical protein AWU67_03335 [Microterricola viridarii]